MQCVAEYCVATDGHIKDGLNCIAWEVVYVLQDERVSNKNNEHWLFLLFGKRSCPSNESLHTSLNIPTAWPLPHLCPSHTTFFLFPEHTKLAPISGPLHWLFSLPGMLFPQISVCRLPSCHSDRSWNVFPRETLSEYPTKHLLLYHINICCFTTLRVLVLLDLSPLEYKLLSIRTFTALLFHPPCLESCQTYNGHPMNVCETKEQRGRQRLTTCWKRMWRKSKNWDPLKASLSLHLYVLETLNRMGNAFFSLCTWVASH